MAACIPDMCCLSFIWQKSRSSQRLDLDFKKILKLFPKNPLISSNNQIKYKVKRPH